VAVSDCRRNASFAMTLHKGTSVQNTFKPYYSRYVMPIYVLKIYLNNGYLMTLKTRWVYNAMCHGGISSDACIVQG